MATAEDYDRYASECLRVAASASDQGQRLLFLEMAQAWVRLARNTHARAPFMNAFSDLPPENNERG
jgi:hypothetical protein